LPEQFLLATIHRAENTDETGNLSRILSAFSACGKPIVWPMHPRTRKSLAGNFSLPSNVILCDPVGYLQMLWLTMHSEKVLTDSGGLQKEAYFLGKPCITIRTETEWVETLHDSWNTITGTDPGQIVKAVSAPLPSARRLDAFGDGHAAEKITRLLIS
jgi:UDP-GlcNAc3NAcA epimerase